MLLNVKKMVVAFSSGPDSVCLLDTLYQLYGQRIEIFIVYINHRLRQSNIIKKEIALTKWYAKQYKAKHKIIEIKVKKGKDGLEATARDERYSALLIHAKNIGAQRIALGHNLDDLMETFFMNIVRGSGSRGLRSIPPVRLPFIRPLINVPRKEIMEYINARHLISSIDETNKSYDFRRNLMRLKIIPQLIELNPRLSEAIQRETELLREDDEYLEKCARELYLKTVKKLKNHITLDIKKIMSYNKVLVSRVVQHVIRELAGDLDGFERKHIEAVVGLKNKRNWKRTDLPKGIYAQKTRNEIIFARTVKARYIKVPIGLQDEVVVLDRILVRTGIRKSVNRIQRRDNIEVFDLAGIELPLFIRTRKPGDELETNIGKKKIKKIFSELEVPWSERNKILMLCDKKGILWIFGCRRAFRGYIGKNTKRILVVEYKEL